jgi:hypothetical protein
MSTRPAGRDPAGRTAREEAVMRPIEAVPAVFVLLMAAAIFFGTAGLSYWDGPTPGARFFPAVLAIAGTVVALLLLWAQRRGIETIDVQVLDPLGFARVGASIATLIVFAVGIPLVGFVPMLAIFVLVMLLAVLRQPLLPSVAAAAFVAGFVHVVFVRWLSVPLPMPFGI